MIGKFKIYFVPVPTKSFEIFIVMIKKKKYIHIKLPRITFAKGQRKGNECSVIRCPKNIYEVSNHFRESRHFTTNVWYRYKIRVRTMNKSLITFPELTFPFYSSNVIIIMITYCLHSRYSKWYVKLYDTMTYPYTRSGYGNELIWKKSRENVHS